MLTTRVKGIPVLWIEPAQGEQRRLVIWLPGFTESKESTTAHLVRLAEAGFVALSFDPVDHGERSQRADEEELDPDSGRFRDPASGHLYRHFWSIEAETVEEVPAIIDWAMAELDVLPAVGMGGKSMGGDIAVAAAALDHRIAAVAACIATPDWRKPGSIYALSAPNPRVQAHYARHNPLTNLERYRHCPAISFQCARGDPMVPADGAVRFVRALEPIYRDFPDRVEAVLHEGAEHELTEAMWCNAQAWLACFL